MEEYPFILHSAADKSWRALGNIRSSDPGFSPSLAPLLLSTYWINTRISKGKLEAQIMGGDAWDVAVPNRLLGVVWDNVSNVCIFVHHEVSKVRFGLDSLRLTHMLRMCIIIFTHENRCNMLAAALQQLTAAVAAKRFRSDGDFFPAVARLLPSRLSVTSTSCIHLGSMLCLFSGWIPWFLEPCACCSIAETLNKNTRGLVIHLFATCSGLTKRSRGSLQSLLPNLVVRRGSEKMRAGQFIPFHPSLLFT